MCGTTLISGPAGTGMHFSKSYIFFSLHIFNSPTPVCQQLSTAECAVAACPLPWRSLLPLAPTSQTLPAWRESAAKWTEADCAPHRCYLPCKSSKSPWASLAAPRPAPFLRPSPINSSTKLQCMGRQGMESVSGPGGPSLTFVMPTGRKAVVSCTCTSSSSSSFPIPLTVSIRVVLPGASWKLLTSPSSYLVNARLCGLVSTATEPKLN